MASTSLGRLYVDLLMKTGSFETDAGRAAKIAEKRAREIDKAFANVGKNVASSLKGIGLQLAGAFAGLAVGGKILGVQREFDVLNAQLITATGSTNGAAKAFENLQKFAAKTPFELSQSVEAFVKLTNLGLTPSERALTSYGNTASAMGKDLSRLIEAVADATTGEFERMKEFGIKAKQQGDKVSLTFRGTTTTIGKSAAEIEAYLIGLGEVEFDGAMARRMDTLDGRISNLGDSFDLLFLTISQGGIGDTFADAVDSAAEAISQLTEEIKAGEYDAFFQTIEEISSGLGDLSSALSDATGETSALSLVFSVVTDTATIVVDIFRVLGTTIGGMIAGADGLYQSLLGITTLDFSRMREGLSLATMGADAAYNAFFNGEDNSGKSLARFGQTNPFANVQSSVTSTFDAPPAARARGAQPVSGKAKKSGKPALTEEQKAAQELQRAYESLQARQLESIALFGKEGEAVKLRYDIESGALKGLSATKADALIANAERLDQLRDEAELQKKLDEITKQQDERYQDTIKGLQDEYDALGLSNEALRIRNELQRTGVTLDSERGRSIEAMVKSIESQAKMVEGLDTARGIAYDLFVDLPNGAADAWKNALAQIESMLLQWAAKGLVDKLFGQQGTTGGGTAGGDWLGGLFSAFTGGGASGGGGGWLSAIAGLFGGGRADGGPVMGGKMYDVTERGLPELVTIRNRQLMIMPPGTSGKVTPMRPGAGGGITVYQSLYSTVPHTRRSSMQVQQDAAFEIGQAARRK